MIPLDQEAGPSTEMIHSEEKMHSQRGETRLVARASAPVEAAQMSLSKEGALEDMSVDKSTREPSQETWSLMDLVELSRVVEHLQTICLKYCTMRL